MQLRNKDKCRYESKSSITDRVCKEDYVWSPSICDCKIVEYL